MGRRKEGTSRRERMAEMLMEEFEINSVKDIENALKELLGETIEKMLKEEITEHLDYEYNEVPTGTNRRNGHNKKQLKSSYGNIDINVPRDREGTFNPLVVPKYENDISGIENQIISMYSKGMSTRDISKHIDSIYGFKLSQTTVSNITNKIIPSIEEWQNRPLQEIYPIVYLDAIHYNVKDNGVIVKKAVYIALGYNLDGFKEIIGMWIGENESSKYWLKILNEIQARGVKDILIISTDNLPGFSQAIEAVYPKTEIQKCIIHQIRNSTRYVSYKDIKEVMKDMKLIYKAPTEQIALLNFESFKEKWYEKYPNCCESWERNWTELTTYFKYPEYIRKLIYTTNSIEAFNRQLRKVTKTKSIFPSDQALYKMLYLTMVEASNKWTSRIKEWDRILSQLRIYFEGRL